MKFIFFFVQILGYLLELNQFIFEFSKFLNALLLFYCYSNVLIFG
jgi:hypothetical protein